MFKYVFWFLLFFNGDFLTVGATVPLAPPASYGHDNVSQCCEKWVSDETLNSWCLVRINFRILRKAANTTY